MKRSGEDNRKEKLRRRKVKGRRKSLHGRLWTREPYCYLLTENKRDKCPISKVVVAYGHWQTPRILTPKLPGLDPFFYLRIA